MGSILLLPALDPHFASFQVSCFHIHRVFCRASVPSNARTWLKVVAQSRRARNLQWRTGLASGAHGEVPGDAAFLGIRWATELPSTDRSPTSSAMKSPRRLHTSSLRCTWHFQTSEVCQASPASLSSTLLLFFLKVQHTTSRKRVDSSQMSRCLARLSLVECDLHAVLDLEAACFC